MSLTFHYQYEEFGDSVSAGGDRVSTYATSSAENGNTSTVWLARRVGKAGTSSNLKAKVLANSCSTTQTVTVAEGTLGGTDLNQVVTVAPADNNLEKEDTANNDSISVGDLLQIAMEAPSGSGSTTYQAYSNHYSATSNTVSLGGTNSSGNAVFTGAADLYATCLGGRRTIDVADPEIRATTQVTLSATFANSSVHLDQNARTTTTTMISRVDELDGNQSLALTGGASQTIFTDTSNTDSVVSGNFINYEIQFGAGSENISFEKFSCDLESTADEGWIGLGGTYATFNDNTTNYMPIGGNINGGTTESDFTHTIGYDCTLRRMGGHVSRVSGVTSVNLTTRVGGTTDGNQTVSLTNIDDGIDTSNTDSYNASDLFTVELDSPLGGGSYRIQSIVWAMEEDAGGVERTISGDVQHVSEPNATALTRGRGLSADVQPVIEPAATTLQRNINPIIAGDVQHVGEILASALTRGTGLNGDVQHVVESVATLQQNSNPTISGDVQNVVEVLASFAKGLNIAGDVQHVAEIVATLVKQTGASIAGDVQHVIEPSALSLLLGRGISGDVQVVAEVLASSLLLNRNYSILGQTDQIVEVLSTLNFSANPTIAGDVQVVLEPASTMTLSAQKQIAGDVQFVTEPAAALNYASERAISGDVQHVAEILANMIQGRGMQGDVQPIIEPAAIALALNSNLVISGDVQYAIEVQASIAATLQRLINGDVQFVIEPNSTMQYGAIFASGNDQIWQLTLRQTKWKLPRNKLN